MRRTAHTTNKAETRTLLAATLACYLISLVCVLGTAYSLAALAAPGIAQSTRTALEAEARP
jgi:hypothetical protein